MGNHDICFFYASDLWEAVEKDYEANELQENPTLNQIKYHKEMKQRKSRVKSCHFLLFIQKSLPKLILKSTVGAEVP